MHLPSLGWERCFSQQEAQHQGEHLTPQVSLYSAVSSLCTVQGIPSFQGITTLLPAAALRETFSAWNYPGEQQHNPNIYLQHLTWTLSRSPVWRGNKHTARKVFEPAASSEQHTEGFRGWDCRSCPSSDALCPAGAWSTSQVTAVIPADTKDHSQGRSAGHWHFPQIKPHLQGSFLIADPSDKTTAPMPGIIPDGRSAEHWHFPQTKAQLHSQQFQSSYLPSEHTWEVWLRKNGFLSSTPNGVQS